MSDFQIENGELVEYTEGWGCGDPDSLHPSGIGRSTIATD